MQDSRGASPAVVEPLTTLPHVVVVGAGFGGLSVARALAGRPVRVTLVDRRNFHTFQPLLYQVATAGLEAESIAHPVRGIFHGRTNLDVRMATVEAVDWDERTVRTTEGVVISFDYLVLCAGAVSATYGIPGVDEHGLPLKTLSDALALRSHLLRLFELADAGTAESPVADEAAQDGELTVVIAGGGPTGVELAGALAELFTRVLVKDYPRLDMQRAHVVVVEGTDRLLPTMSRDLGEHARRTLAARGVEVRLGELVDRVTDRAVHLRSGSVIPTRMLVWAAGVRASPLAGVLGLQQDRGGRLAVGADLRVPGHRGVFAIGDVAAGRDAAGELLPQLAPVAIQQGRHVAAEIVRAEAGRPPRPFRYRDKGTMATIGRNDAVAELPLGIHFRGFIGWVLWLSLHLVTLIGFRNRASVLVDWSWNYLTYERGVRLIVDVDEDTR
jgi:NADH dehydrogenase